MRKDGELSRERKILAAYQFFLYTLLGSLFMLLGILIIYYQSGTTDYQYLLGSVISEKIVFARENLLWLTFFLSFAVKVPMWPVFGWLPEAHTEAPTGGSMLLAGILLKLAGYGFIRYSLPLFPNSSEYFTILIYTISTISIIYSTLSCLRQIDLKKIIAYSSIAHMGVSILGIFSNNLTALQGSIFMMISHGIVSPALFFCIGLLYDRTGTRFIKYMRGFSITMPLFSLIFFILILSNMAVPGTIGFIGEYLSFYGSFIKNPLICIVVTSSIVLGAALNIWLTNRIIFGNLSKYFDSYNDLTRREFFVLFPFIFLSILLGLIPNIILNTINFSCSTLVL